MSGLSCPEALQLGLSCSVACCNIWHQHSLPETQSACHKPLLLPRQAGRPTLYQLRLTSQGVQAGGSGRSSSSMS